MILALFASRFEESESALKLRSLQASSTAMVVPTGFQSVSNSGIRSFDENSTLEMDPKTAINWFRANR